MIAKIRLVTNADEIDAAYARQENSTRKVKIPKAVFTDNPITLDAKGIKIAYISESGDINIRHSDYADWIALKNEPDVWSEICEATNVKKVGGFLSKKSQKT